MNEKTSAYRTNVGAMKRRLAIFCQEPYRVFFPLGLIFGMIGASHWLWYALGWTSSCSGFFHSSIQTLGYINCFVMGFLMTAIPKFSNSRHASAAELGAAFAVTCLMVTFLLLNQWIGAELMFLGWLAFLIFFIARRFMKMERNPNNLAGPPVEFVWIPIGVFHGLTGTLLLLGSQIFEWPVWLSAPGKSLMQMGFLIAVVAGVGGFLAPRLMGHFEPVPWKNDMEKMRMLRRKKVLMHILLGVLLYASFWLEAYFTRGAFLLRAVIITSSLFMTRAWPRYPKVSDLFLILLWISVWMMVIGSWSLVLFPQARSAMMHFILIGGFSLMTFSIGTMVTLSHGGEAPLIRKPLFVLWLVLGTILVSLFLRIVCTVSPKNYFHLLGWAAGVWMTGATVWLCFIAPRILRTPVSQEEFERCHEEAKQRVMKPKT